jgi:hypothetical protein
MNATGVVATDVTNAMLNALERGDTLESVMATGLYKLVDVIDAAWDTDNPYDADERGLLTIEIEDELSRGWPLVLKKIGYGRKFESSKTLDGHVQLHITLATGVVTRQRETGLPSTSVIGQFARVLRVYLWDVTVNIK